MKKPNRYPFFAQLCVSQGLPKPVDEYCFAKPRKWRFDFAFPEYRIALEVEGGLFINGGHSRGSGKRKDHEKFTAAAVLGWRILYCEPRMVMSIDTIANIRTALYFNAGRI